MTIEQWAAREVEKVRAWESRNATPPAPEAETTDNNPPEPPARKPKANQASK